MGESGQRCAGIEYGEQSLSRREVARILSRGGLLIRRKRNLFIRLLAVAFLCAQFGMLAHAGTHLKADPHGAPATQLCGECLSFSPLQNMIGGAPAVVLATPVSHDRVREARAVLALPPQAFTAFRSRAPPILL